ncbi:MAG: protein translocase subunit SecD [Rhodospirillaceae bacterium]|nr:MAG: protein translocase subunit SecD [Rhodospirillaceae bacterium]
MLHYSASKVALVLAISFLGFVFASPNLMTKGFRDSLPSWMTNVLKPIQLGLDLQGGSYLLLEVDLDAVTKEQIVNLEETVRATLREPRIGFRNLRAAEDGVFVSITDPEQFKQARDLIVKAAVDLNVESLDEGRLHITIPDKVKKEREIAAMSQSIEIVRRRVDEFGTSEPSIQRSGSDRIIVELPGVDNPERIKALIGQTAKLNFHLLEPGVTAMTDPRNVPPGVMMVPGGKDDPERYAVRRRVEVSGERLVDAQATFQEGRPVVTFRFDTQGGRRFGGVTAANVNQRLAIVLDNTVISAPNIKSPITGGSGYIEGSFTVQNAQDLALLLRAGALPAPLIILEERSVGPGLGADSIAAGETASVIGVILVAGFMVLAYFTFGLFAVAALTVNIVLLFALMSIIGATLTLPGIAGVVLTLGMAVDANVLIYERMREEYNNGRTLLNSLSSGFSQAFMTILDSNVTTVIAGLLLYFLGTGPVKGFAVTLVLGLMTSMFSAVMITRLLIWLWFRSAKRTVLPL